MVLILPSSFRTLALAGALAPVICGAEASAFQSIDDQPAVDSTEPTILTGVRVATVVGVGTATIASAIGAGGLGDYIFRGLSMVDGVVILAGALPAAALALIADGLLAVAARAFDRRRGTPALRRAMAATILLAILVGAVAYRSISSEAVVVGLKAV